MQRNFDPWRENQNNNITDDPKQLEQIQCLQLYWILLPTIHFIEFSTLSLVMIALIRLKGFSLVLFIELYDNVLHDRHMSMDQTLLSSRT